MLFSSFIRYGAVIVLFECLGILGVCMSTVTFQSEEHLVRAFNPLNANEVRSRVEKSTGATAIHIQYDDALDSYKAVPLRHYRGGNLLGAKVFEGGIAKVT